jgi:hypothetical protein
LSALEANTTGSNNTATGYQALYSNTTGGLNTAFGHKALYSNNTHYNVAFGNQAAQNNTSGNDITAIGYEALKANTTGDNCVAVGWNALSSHTTGNSNVAVGHQAGRYTTTGNSVVFIGDGAGKQSTTATGSVCIGAQSSGSGGGNYNTAMGYYAGYHLTSGTNNLLLGKNSGRSTSPSGALTDSSNKICLGDDNMATFYCVQSSIQTSDSRDKTDITDFTGGLDWVNQMNPKTYHWDKRSWYLNGDATPQDILDVTPDGTHKRDDLQIGFLAQDILAIEQANGYADNNENSLIVNLTEDTTRYGLAYERMVPILVNAIKELSAEVEALKAQLNS